MKVIKHDMLNIVIAMDKMVASIPSELKGNVELLVSIDVAEACKEYNNMNFECKAGQSFYWLGIKCTITESPSNNSPSISHVKE